MIPSANVLRYQNKKHPIVCLITHEGPSELKTRRVTIRLQCRYILLSVDIEDGFDIFKAITIASK
jgi:hypothetical protein